MSLNPPSHLPHIILRGGIAIWAITDWHYQIYNLTLSKLNFYYSNALYACIGASNCCSVFLFGIFGHLKVLAFNFIPFVTIFPYCLCLILICFYPNDLAIWLIISFQHKARIFHELMHLCIRNLIGIVCLPLKWEPRFKFLLTSTIY